MQDRHELNAFLKESGLALAGDLVHLEPARSRTMEVRRSEKAVVATISTAARDRHGDVIDPRGVRLERFRKNPVVLYAHDYDGLPVARSLWERVRDGDDSPELVAKPQFHMDTELSREVWALIEKGVLSAWSVGFIPEEWEPIRSNRQDAKDAKDAKGVETEANQAGDTPRSEEGPAVLGALGALGTLAVKDVAAPGPGFRVKKWDLLEYSAVPVAANFEALTRELKDRRITAPALVKSLAPLGMREPDLVAQPVKAEETADLTTENTESTREAEGEAQRNISRTDVDHGRCHEAQLAGRSRLVGGASVVKNAVANGFDRWLERARGGLR